MESKKMNLSEFEMLQTIGEGSFGTVKIAKKKDTGTQQALKILKKADILRLKQVDHVCNEMDVVSVIDHPFIVGLDGYTTDRRQIYLVIEFIGGGELFNQLRNIGRLDVSATRFQSAHIILIFEYLHSKNIIQRDLKPENILISTNGQLKLTDFGFAKKVEGRTQTQCGTPEQLAPEILLSKGHGKAVDWWTIGILIQEMLAGIDPFNDEDPQNVYQRIIDGKLKFPRFFDQDARSLVKHLLVSDLTKRQGSLKNGVSDIKTHRFFNGFDWEHLLQKKQTAPYIPSVKNAWDISNFATQDTEAQPSPMIRPEDDPFIDW